MKIKIIVLVAVVIVLVGCRPTQITDNGLRVGKNTDQNLYSLSLVVKAVSGYNEINGSFYQGSGSIWVDGKGMIRGTVLSIDPEVLWAKPENEIVVKTTDRKAMMLQDGDIVDFLCTADYEPVCSISQNGREVGECRDKWEFDYCRIDNFTGEQIGEQKQ